ncbi:MAG TPA: hypothetical protein P5186_00715 [Candidatus Paceibacterota bacterium]|nr:hypothetical protein [Candidatus Paceibacterota bacterium]HSA02921.1 hypothetical protein [Candidatus Paceibacterota bacterium]
MGYTMRQAIEEGWPFAHEIKKGDLVILPLKTQPAIQIGEISTPDYHFEPAGPDPFFHWRPVKWIGEAVLHASRRMAMRLLR